MVEHGRIVILNGAPRSGKSSIAAAIQADVDGVWMNIGVDLSIAATPSRLLPGIGLRPGGERPDLEWFVSAAYTALYGSVVAHSRLGLDVVVDIGHHDAYSVPLGILPRVARQLVGLPALFVGVRCPIDVIMARRDAARSGRRYATSEADGSIPAVVYRWQSEVHSPGIYDLEVDTAMSSPSQCADAIRRRLLDGAPPTAFRQLADLTPPD